MYEIDQDHIFALRQFIESVHKNSSLKYDIATLTFINIYLSFQIESFGGYKDVYGFKLQNPNQPPKLGDILFVTKNKTIVTVRDLGDPKLIESYNSLAFIHYSFGKFIRHELDKELIKVIYNDH